MMFREIIAIINVNKQCGKNAKCLNVNFVIHVSTIELYDVDRHDLVNCFGRSYLFTPLIYETR